jgi:hypothetical protein
VAANFRYSHLECNRLLNKSLNVDQKAANCERNWNQKSHGTDSGNRAGVSSSKEKKDADSGERGAQRQKRSKDKLIRLDDLIPDEKVVGGGKYFGATDTTQNQKNN